MAAKGRRVTSPQRLKEDRLVEQLVPDPATHEPAIQLFGWLGKDTAEGAWRLYLTPQLDVYVQFSEADVVHSQPVQEGQSSLGGTTVWLRAGTVLQHTQVIKQQVQADFLSGGITSGFMGGSESSFPMAAPYARAGGAASRNYVCSMNWHIPACQLRTDFCGPQTMDCPSGAICPSGAFVCGVTAKCTVHKECSVEC